MYNSYECATSDAVSEKSKVKCYSTLSCKSLSQVWNKYQEKILEPGLNQTELKMSIKRCQLFE